MHFNDPKLAQVAEFLEWGEFELDNDDVGGRLRLRYFDEDGRFKSDRHAVSAALFKRMLQEELNELVNELENEGTAEDVLDALIDLQYILYNVVLRLGLAYEFEVGFNIVHASNMSKGDALGNPIFDDGGKIMKGPFFAPPDLSRAFQIANEFRSSLFAQTGGEDD